MQVRAFPPGQGNLKIPVSSSRSARAGLAMYAPCRLRGVLVRWMAWHLVGLFGAGVLPGRSTHWIPPMPRDVWLTLADRWSAAVGSFDGVAVHERLQVSRSGFALLLLLRGDPIAFVKVREDGRASVENEFRALEALTDYGPHTFAIPRPLAIGNVAGWHFLATSALEPELHRMPRDPALDEVLRDVREGLAAIGRAPSTPEHWEPMHGDLTPWNLRQRRDGSLTLLDWEEAAWAPPGADELYYRLFEAVMSGRRFEISSFASEPRRFWTERLLVRQSVTTGDRDAQLVDRLLSMLRG